MTAPAIQTIRKPQTGEELADMLGIKFESVQKQYRRKFADTLPRVGITDIHVKNVCSCYPDHPLSQILSGQADKTKQTQIIKMRTPSTIADNQTDTLKITNKELEEQKAHYERLLENNALELKKTRSEALQNQSDMQTAQDELLKTVRTLQEDNNKLMRTLQAGQTDKGELVQTLQTVQTDRDELMRTVQTLQTTQDELAQALQTAQTDRDELMQTIQTLQDELQRAKQTFKFRFKTLFNAELEGINLLSIGFAIYGFFVLFGIVGLFMSVVMALFLKNTIKNMKNSKKKVVEFGMRIAIFIECVFGLFHFTTFYNLLLPIEDKLILPFAGFFALLMAGIFSGLSIASLKQQNNQV